MIRALESQKDIKEGEEITVSYSLCLHLHLCLYL